MEVSKTETDIIYSKLRTKCENRNETLTYRSRNKYIVKVKTIAYRLENK